MYAYFEDVNWGLLRLWGDRSGKSILDVGCGYATTSERLRRLGNRVTGIESSAEAVAVASERLDEVVAADLQDTAKIGDRRFDAIVFADVLEHLSWPETILKQYLRFLAPGGSVIVSLPNVGLWSVRLSLLTGRFEYADTGVLDRTHLRFFTRRTARRLIEEAGLSIVRHTYNPGIVRPFVPLVKKMMSSGSEGDPAAILESRPYRAYLRTVYPIERAISSLWPGALAFQMIFEARPR
ncbi:MAG TPA: class I SAM-dependent methyltransferase [Thermoanaerobaculia bacterium]|nr:class I SAM-dependent methyltransferase [Thermoanaerobaculia bacterium]